jgi:thiamine-phosphate pyrophosphorylase
MRATRLPRLHVITDTRGPFAPDVGTAASEASPALRGDAPAAALHVPKPASLALLRDPLVVVAAALAAGARLIQVRPEDHYNDRAAFDLATAVAALCDEYGALCLVNDRVHIAQAIGADGVHLGAEDLPIDAARRILPAASIIGGTSRDPESARAARRAGATYLGVGPVWGTTTKTGLPQPIGLDGLAAVCEAVDLPVIAIGGITAERAARCREAGAHGVAVVGAIASAEDPIQAAAELLEAVGESPATTRGATGSGAPRGERTAARRSGDASAPAEPGGPGEAPHDDGPEVLRDIGILRGVGDA